MDPLIENYQQLAALTSQIRKAASEGDWDPIPGLDEQCSRVMASIRAAPDAATLDRESRLTIAQIINEIIEIHKEISNLTRPWLGHLQQTLDSASQEKRLQQAYLGR